MCSPLNFLYFAIWATSSNLMERSFEMASEYNLLIHIFPMSDFEDFSSIILNIKSNTVIPDTETIFSEIKIG